MSDDDETILKLTGIVGSQSAALNRLWQLVESDVTWTDADEVATRVTLLVLELRAEFRVTLNSLLRERRDAKYLEPQSAKVESEPSVYPVPLGIAWAIGVPAQLEPHHIVPEEPAPASNLPDERAGAYVPGDGLAKSYDADGGGSPAAEMAQEPEAAHV